MQRKPYPKAVLLDYDGTLIDSALQVYLGTCNVLKMSNIAVPTFPEFCETYMAPYDVYYKSLGITASKEEIIEWYFSASTSDESPWFPDVLETLSHFHEKGHMLGIISAHYEDRIVARCKEFGVLEYMQTVVGRAHNKVPHLLSLCKKYNISPKDVCYVGDFASDVRDAREAGVVSVGITRGNNTKEMLFRNGADFCIDTLAELQHIFT